MGAVEIVGVSAEVLADPRVQSAMESVTKGPELQAASAMNDALSETVEKYGIKLRKCGLAVVGPWLAELSQFDFSSSEMMSVMLFLLGADKRTILESLRKTRQGDDIGFLVRASDWVENSGIPNDFSADTKQAVEKTFALANKLLAGGDDGGKKA